MPGKPPEDGDMNVMTQDSKFEPRRFEAELPVIMILYDFFEN